MSSPQRSSSAVQRVISLILDRIRFGDYAPGQIVIARELMQELGLSKAPVREAIHVLVGEGVMDLLENRSARIRKLTHKDLLDFTAAWGGLGGVNLRLGGSAINTAAQRDQVRAALAQIERAGEGRSSYEFFLAIGLLHRTMVDLSGNELIRTFITRAHFAHFYRHLERYFPGPYWDEHLLAFRRIGEALLDDDGDEAERQYVQHMRWVYDILAEASAETVAAAANARQPARTRRPAAL